MGSWLHCRRTILLGIPVWLAGWGRGGSKTLYAVMAADGRFATWRAVIDEAGLANLLEHQSPVTCFFPTDAAFRDGPDVHERAGPGETKQDRARRLRNLVLSHILPGLHTLQEIVSSTGSFPNLSDGTISFSSVGTSSLTVEWNSRSAQAGAAINESPLPAANGLLYPLSRIFVA